MRPFRDIVFTDDGLGSTTRRKMRLPAMDADREKTTSG